MPEAAATVKPAPKPIRGDARDAITVEYGADAAGSKRVRLAFAQAGEGANGKTLEVVVITPAAAYTLAQALHRTSTAPPTEPLTIPAPQPLTIAPATPAQESSVEAPSPRIP